jgi:hypothetical protein
MKRKDVEFAKSMNPNNNNTRTIIKEDNYAVTLSE